jgi:hypothetical protein
MKRVSAVEEPEMRLHRHQVGRAERWHSVRVRHERLWDWCAHHEEIERYLSRRRRLKQLAGATRHLKLEAAR